MTTWQVSVIAFIAALAALLLNGVLYGPNGRDFVPIAPTAEGCCR